MEIIKVIFINSTNICRLCILICYFSIIHWGSICATERMIGVRRFFFQKSTFCKETYVPNFWLVPTCVHTHYILVHTYAHFHFYTLLWTMVKHAQMSQSKSVVLCCWAYVFTHFERMWKRGDTSLFCASHSNTIFINKASHFSFSSLISWIIK